VKLTGQRSLCRTCGVYFNSTAAFDKHRIGTHGVDRRCMTVDEMLAKGMAQAASGFWVTALRHDYDCTADHSSEVPHGR
jgi:hypothetical protein